MGDLLTRACNMSAMLRMCEKISFGSDADVIDELVEEVERLRSGVKALAIEDEVDSNDGDYSQGWKDGRWSMKGLAKRLMDENR